MKCPYCHKTIPFVSGSFCNHCGALITSTTHNLPPPAQELMPTTHPVAENPKIPWESDLRSSVPLTAFCTTCIQVLFHPDLFFKQATAQQYKSIKPALMYGLITGSFGIFASWLWCEIYSRYSESFTDYTTLFGNTFTSPSILIATPILLLIQFIVAATYTACVMRLSNHKKASLSSLIRIICYAESASVVQIIPILGSFASIVLSVHTVLTGFHHLFGTSRVKLIFLLAVPLLVLSVLLMIIFFAGILGGAIAGIGFLQNWQSILR